MDTEKSSQPLWWILLLVLAVMIGLLALAHRLVPSPGWREALDIGILFFSYGLLALWLQTNRAALNNAYSGRTKTRIAIIDPPMPLDDLPSHIRLDSDAVYDNSDLPRYLMLRNN